MTATHIHIGTAAASNLHQRNVEAASELEALWFMICAQHPWIGSLSTDHRAPQTQLHIVYAGLHPVTQLGLL